MVEINGAYKYGKHEGIWSDILCVMSNLKVFATWADMIDYINPYVTHMDPEPQT